eukprot:m.80856 g.80856  ORF g.80856 m.80856 type:complete len:67 (+) comp17509_c0_seq1:541-741(+)
MLQLLNTGDLRTLMKISGIGKKRAEHILRFREQERQLQKIEDLRLCGCGEKLVCTFLEKNAGCLAQ